MVTSSVDLYLRPPVFLQLLPWIKRVPAPLQKFDLTRCIMRSLSSTEPVCCFECAKERYLSDWRTQHSQLVRLQNQHAEPPGGQSSARGEWPLLVRAAVRKHILDGSYSEEDFSELLNVMTFVSFLVATNMCYSSTLFTVQFCRSCESSLWNEICWLSK